MNSIILSGRVATALETKATKTGGEMCTFRLAVRKEKRDEVMYVPIKCFKTTAENCQKYLVKGQRVIVKGNLSLETYERDGKRLTWTEVLADMVEFGEKPRKEEAEDIFGKNVLTDDEDLPF